MVEGRSKQYDYDEFEFNISPVEKEFLICWNKLILFLPCVSLTDLDFEGVDFNKEGIDFK